MIIGKAAVFPKRILYITHRASTSPEEEWCSYLSSKGAEVHLIGHPFPYKKPNASHWIIWNSGRIVRRTNLGPSVTHVPELLFFLKDFLLNFLLVFLLRFKPVDLCISADPLNTCSILFFRKCGWIRHLIHYTIDYAPVRSKNKALNSLYHFLDRLACYHSDTLWVLSPRMMTARFSNGVDQTRCAPVVVVPMGADLSRIQVPVQPPQPRRLVYMGSLRENQGLDLCVEVFAKLRKKFPDLTWEIVGEGWKRTELEKKLKDLGQADSVVWHGFQADHRDLERILSRGGVGLALYEPSPDTYTNVADPGKPKIYMACGLPVLITSVPAVADEIARSGAGEIIPYEVSAAVETLTRWFVDEEKMKALRKAALALAKRYDWPFIFEKTLSTTFSKPR